jgi:hypothetical protein
MSLRRAIALSFVLVIIGVRSAAAQVASTAAASPTRNWNVDLSGTAGVVPGVGAATTGFDLSAAVALVRSIESFEATHQCRGVTVMFTSVRARSSSELASPREHAVLIGPRWDGGGFDGTLFLRVLGGVRSVSGFRTGTSGPEKFSKRAVGVGAGVGMEVLGVLFDVNWITSPWAEDTSSRLSVSIGYIWSSR